MSKTPAKGKGERFNKGGGAGRHPGNEDAVRATPGFLARFLGVNSLPSNVGARKSGTKPKGRGKQLLKDTKGPAKGGGPRSYTDPYL